MGIAGILKLALIMIVAFFVIKMASKWLANKFPNKVTSAADAVIQTA